MHPRRRVLGIVAAMVVATGFGVSTAVAAPSRTADPQPGGWSLPRAVPAAGTFYPTGVSRLLGTPDSGYALEPGTVTKVAAAGRDGLPRAGVSAVVVNVVAQAGPVDAALSFARDGASAGLAAPAPLLVAPAGATRSALLTLPLAATGAVLLSTSASASVVVDLVGFYAADDTVLGSHGVSGGYQPVDITRLFDSSTGTAQPLAPGATQVVSVDLGTAATPHTTALLVRATAAGTAAPGTLTVGSAADPVVPTVSFAAGAASTNLAVVPATLGADGRLGVVLTNVSTGATGVTLDLIGFYDDGTLGPNLRFRPLPQTRIVDTASGLGAASLPPDTRVTVTPSDAVVGDSTFALVGVVSVTPTGGSAGLDVDLPDATTTSAVELGTGTTSLAVQPQVGAGRGLGLEARAGSAPTAVTIDVTGSFEAYPPVTNPAARGWVTAVSGWQVSASAR